MFVYLINLKLTVRNTTQDSTTPILAFSRGNSAQSIFNDSHKNIEPPSLQINLFSRWCPSSSKSFTCSCDCINAFLHVPECRMRLFCGTQKWLIWRQNSQNETPIIIHVRHEDVAVHHGKCESFQEVEKCCRHDTLNHSDIIVENSVELLFSSRSYHGLRSHLHCNLHYQPPDA